MIAAAEPGSLPHVVTFIVILAAIAVAITIIRSLFKTGRRMVAAATAFVLASGSIPTWLAGIEPWLQSKGWWPQ